MKKIIVVFTILFFLSSTSVVLPSELEEPTAGEIIADVIISRPAGFFSLIVGSGFFVIALPFTLLTGTVKVAGEKLVVAPYTYTFERPVGQW